MMSVDNGPVKGGKLAFDPVEVYKVTAKILSYIQGLSKEVNKSCDSINLKNSFNEKKPGLKEIYNRSSLIYNEHTL